MLVRTYLGDRDVRADQDRLRTRLLSAGDKRALVILEGQIAATEAFVGPFDSALVHLRLGIDAAHQNGFRDLESELEETMGLLFDEIGQDRDALQHLRAACAIASQDGGASRVAEIDKEIGDVFNSSSQADSAIAEFKTAFDLVREDSTQELFLISLQESIGHSYSIIGQHDYAADIYHSVIADAQKHDDRIEEIAALRDLSSTFVVTGRPDSAISYALRARELEAGPGTATRSLASALLSVAEAYQLARGEDAARLASIYYDSTAWTYRELRQHAGADAVRRRVGDWEQLLYSKWAALLLTTAVFPDSESRSYAALAAAERGRAGSMGDYLDSTPAPARGADLALEGRRLVETTTRRGEALLYYLLLPRGMVVWYVASDRQLRVLPHTLSTDTLHSTLALWRDLLGVTREPREQRFARQDPEVRPPSDRDAVAVGRSISGYLIPPAIDSLAKSRTNLSRGVPLIIVGHAFLGNVPFGALSVSDGSYLGEHFAIEFAASLRVRAALDGRASRLRASEIDTLISKDQILVVGDPAFPSCESRAAEPCFPGKRLPDAKNEAVAVAKLFSVRPLTDSQASEVEVRHRLPRAAIVHIASHGEGIASDGLDDPSRLWLARSDEGGAAADGQLTAEEILADSTFDLSADLVFLSGCETGVGTVQLGEGLVSLSRAFLMRGAQTVIASLWQVNDKAMEQLAEHFYRRWLFDPDHPTAPEALRRAQLDLRGTRVGLRRIRTYDKPRYWAALYVNGRAVRAPSLADPHGGFHNGASK